MALLKKREYSPPQKSESGMAAAPQEVIELLIFTQLCLFLDALAYLKTMFKIQSFSKSCFQDFKITEY